jgi:hypothetical protein
MVVQLLPLDTAGWCGSTAVPAGLLFFGSGFSLVFSAIQIRLNQNNVNRDNGFTLSRAWNPETKLLFTHNLDPGKAAIEPAHRPVA